MELCTALCIVGALIVGLLVALLRSDGDLTLMFYDRWGKPLDTLRSKVVWITGASSGIGEHLAYELAAVGCKLILSARRENELERVKNQCLFIGKKAGLEPKDVLVLPLDVTKLESHKESVDKVLSHFGKLDVLVNNAGRSQRAVWENIDIAVDRSLFDLNVFGLVNLTRLVMPHFLQNKSGHIAVTSSTAGKVGVSYSASYTASKHALHGYFESLRTEKYPDGIRVTMLCPGPVFSDLLSGCATDKPGESLGQQMSSTDHRMSTERCARLCAVAIANQLDEAWIALNPVLFIMYAGQYLPSLSRTFMARIGSKLALKWRDSRKDLYKATPEEKKD